MTNPDKGGGGEGGSRGQQSPTCENVCMLHKTQQLWYGWYGSEVLNANSTLSNKLQVFFDRCFWNSLKIR